MSRRDFLTVAIAADIVAVIIVISMLAAFGHAQVLPPVIPDRPFGPHPHQSQKLKLNLKAQQARARHAQLMKLNHGLNCSNGTFKETPCLALSPNAARLPKHEFTPGEVSTRTLKDICSTSTKQYRDTTLAMKKQVCKEYGVANCPAEGKMEIDHLIPLELGGQDSVKNLWVQMAPDYHKKDLLENRLHRNVCSGKQKLDAAQYCISSDWVACYQATFKVKP